MKPEGGMMSIFKWLPVALFLQIILFCILLIALDRIKTPNASHLQVWKCIYGISLIMVYVLCAMPMIATYVILKQ
jgi:hypothetical protein